MSDTALLDDIFESVSAAEAAEFSDSELNPDGAANSCDDDDIDFSEPEEALVIPQPGPGPSTPAAAAAAASSSLFKPQPRPTPPAYRTPTSGSAPAGAARAPLRPASTNRTPINVGASTGRGGRMVYAVQRAENGADSQFFVVQYRKPQQKKLTAETWDGDAFIKVEGSRITLLSDEGKHMATTSLSSGTLGPGSELRIGNWECEVDHPISYDEFKRSTCCLNNAANAPVHAATSSRTPVSKITPLKAATPFKAFKMPTVVSRPVGLPTPGSRPASPAVSAPSEASSSTTPVGAASFYAKPTHAAKRIVIGEKNSKEREAWGGALHDPNAPGAVVMPRPPASEAKRRGSTITDVVIDPLLSSKMREHQKKGVEFMYRCVMGMAGVKGQGCILADEMGLGKTLQTIALIYTLCKQSPWQNESSVIGRALVVCPVSLVNNWKKEFRKWLPRDFGIVAVEDANEHQISSFTHHRGLHVLIIGYERLRKVIKKLAACQPPIGLIVCDEGHRLKSKDNKTTKMFDALSTPRRIMLTGTPVQNDLGEYWAMADFCNQGVFGTYSQFNRQFEKPITKAREPRCSDADAALGQERMTDLYNLTKEFVLRRTAEVLDKYLPPKTEYVVFVAPTALQLDIFAQILGGGKGAALLRGMNQAQLATIDLLRKVSNSPMLLRKKDDDGYATEEIASIIKNATRLVKTGSSDVEISGKMRILDRILRSLYEARADEKIVVVSNWTSTLTIIQELCIKRGYSFLRLDGSTPQKQRQEFVDRFNRGPRSDSMVFLLSAKAGGVGLNLIGASRLVLFDSDWNPSTDLQAMARIHRDGQKKPVYIYRLLTTNTIDEKIYQRQITKTGLSDQMMGGGGSGKGKESKDSFSFEELRDIFSVNLYTDGCQTHDLLGCDCEGQNTVRSDSEASTREPSRAASPESSDDEEKNVGFLPASQFNPEPTPKMRRKEEAAQQAKLAALKEWRHMDPFRPDSIKELADDLLFNLAREDYKEYDEKKDLAAQASTSASSRSDTPEAPPAKKRRGVLDVIDAAVEGPSSDADAVTDSQDEDSDDDDATVGSRRKRASTRLKAVAKTKLNHQMFIPSVVEKKHNMRTLADAGQGGRITYVFEKVAKSGYDVPSEAS